MSSKSKKKNPNNMPCTKIEAEAMADYAFHLAIACTMSTVVETDRFLIEEMQKLWDQINDTADAVSKGTVRLDIIVSKLEKKYGFHFAKIMDYPCSTVGQAKKKARAAYSISCAIMISEIVKTDKFTDDEVVEVWDKLNYKADSIKRGYVNLIEVCEALEEEYNITVGGVIVDKENTT